MSRIAVVLLLLLSVPAAAADPLDAIHARLEAIERRIERLERRCPDASIPPFPGGQLPRPEPVRPVFCPPVYRPVYLVPGHVVFVVYY